MEYLIASQAPYISESMGILAPEFETIEHKVIQTISKYLDCSSHTLNILRLGGYTNWNFKVSFNGKSYFVKLGNSFGDILNVSLQNEVACRAIIEDYELTLPVLSYAPDEAIMLTEFITGKEWDFSNISIGERYFSGLRLLHSLKVQFPKKFCPFQTIQTYMSHAIKMGVCFPQDRFDLLMPKLYALKHWLPNVKKVPCHLDPQIANVLVTDDKIYFVDWECAAMGDPFFDLASLCASEEFSDSEMHNLLSQYLKRLPSKEETKHLYYLRILADMRMCLICFIQTKIRPLEAETYREFAEVFLQQCSQRLLPLKEFDKVPLIDNLI
jgi:thiamine kinase-like enzyme